MNVTLLDNGCTCARLICADPFMCSVHQRLVTDVVVDDMAAGEALRAARVRDRSGRPTPQQWNQRGAA